MPAEPRIVPAQRRCGSQGVSEMPRPSWDQNFGNLRHFETHLAIVDPILEPNWPAKTIKDLERVFEHFWTNKVQKHGYPPQTWGFFGFQDATAAPLFALGFWRIISGSHRGATHDLSRIMESNYGEPARFKCLKDPPPRALASAQVRKNLSENMWVIMNFVRTL